jgi:hypothetical protein
MKFFLVFFLVIVNVSANEIHLISTNEAGKKFSFLKTYEVATDAKKSHSLEVFCKAVASTPRLLINDLQKYCVNESMLFDSATYSSCKWNSKQDIEMVGEFQCVDKALEFEAINCQAESDCRKKLEHTNYIKGMEARRQWHESVMSKLPSIETTKGSLFLDSPENLSDFRNCYLNLTKILFTPINNSEDAQLPKNCTKVIENYEAFKS